MAKFSYEGRKNGELVKGEIEGNDADQAANQLASEGIIPLRITEHQTKQQREALFSFFAPKVSSGELTVFCRQMHALAKAGIPINIAIYRLAEVSNNPILASALHSISKDIALGSPLSSAMRDFPKLFSPLLIALVTTGEANGRIDEAFLQASKHYDLESTTRKRIKTAFRYPSFVLITAFIAVMVINIFVIPKFASLYSHFKAALPLPTRILIGFSDLIKTYWWAVILLAILCVWLCFYLLTKEKFRLTFDRLQLRIPIVGSILQRIIMASFASSLATLLQTGVPLIQALALAGDVANNSYAKQKILQIRKMVARGIGLSKAAHQVSFFSPLILQMLSIGEETGNIDVMLLEVSQFYEKEIDYDIKQLADKVEPLLLAIVSCVVLVLALGVFLPMWDMTYIVH